MIARLFTIIFLILSTNALVAQEGEKNRGQGLVVGLMTSNRGAGAEITYQRRGGRWQQIYNLDFYFVRSLHEVKVEPYPFPDRKYVFGKLNNFWVLSPSFGFQYQAASYSSYNFVDMKVGFKLGPALGILNPYYIKLCSINGACDSQPFNPDIHSYQAISGRASFFSNEFNPEFRLGLSLKAFATLDFNSKAGPISGIRAGINADLFPSEIPIMLPNEDLVNPSALFAATIGFVFGGNW